MNPIKNKKDLETTIDEIKNFAYSYLENYSPSKQQLKTYLYKKLVKKKQNISKILATHLQIIEKNNISIKGIVDNYLSEYNQLCELVKIIGEVTPRLKDKVAAYGEFI